MASIIQQSLLIISLLFSVSNVELFINTMGVNINVIQPTQSSSLNVSDQYDETLTTDSSINDNNNIDEDNPKKFIESILEGPSKDFTKITNDKNDKKTDVSVTIYHHQAIHTPIIDGGGQNNDKYNNTAGHIIYGNGYGLHYGFDLDGKYRREKGYQFEKAMGKETCRNSDDDKSCAMDKFQRRSDIYGQRSDQNYANTNNQKFKDNFYEEDTPDVALKKQILQIIRHNSNVNLDGLHKQRRRIDINQDHHRNNNNNHRRNTQFKNKPLTNLQNYFMTNHNKQPFTKLDSLFINSLPVVDDQNYDQNSNVMNSNDQFYYPQSNQRHKSNKFKSKRNKNRNRGAITILNRSLLSNVYEPEKIIELHDDDWTMNHDMNYYRPPIWRPKKNPRDHPHQYFNNKIYTNDLLRDVSEINAIKARKSAISNDKIHNHWFINTKLDNHRHSQPQNLRRNRSQNHLNEIIVQDFSTSNNYQKSILEPNTNPYSKKYFRFMLRNLKN